MIMCDFGAALSVDPFWDKMSFFGVTALQLGSKMLLSSWCLTRICGWMMLAYSLLQNLVNFVDLDVFSIWAKGANKLEHALFFIFPFFWPPLRHITSRCCEIEWSFSWILHQCTSYQNVVICLHQFKGHVQCFILFLKVCALCRWFLRLLLILTFGFVLLNLGYERRIQK